MVSDYVSPVLTQVHRPCPTSTHAMSTRSKARIFKPKCFHVVSSTLSSNSSPREPNSVAEALLDDKWKKAMSEEYTALIKNGNWTLVPFT